MQYQYLIILAAGVVFMSIPACTHNLNMDQDVYIQYHLGQAQKASMINISKDYTLQHFELAEDGDQYAVHFKLRYPGISIQRMSTQFKKVRRASHGPGWGKYPTGWEFYRQDDLDEHYRFVIDTLSNSLDFSYLMSY